MQKKDIPSRLVLVALLFSVILASLPLSDYDQDGLVESTMSESFVILPALCSIIGLGFSWNRFLTGFLNDPRVSYSPLLPPPISNQ